MTQDQYWQAHIKKHPTFADKNKKIELSVGALQKLMFEAYDKGFEHHAKRVEEIGAQMKARLEKKPGLTGFIDDLFKGIGL